MTPNHPRKSIGDRTEQGTLTVSVKSSRFVPDIDIDGKHLASHSRCSCMKDATIAETLEADMHLLVGSKSNEVRASDEDHVIGVSVLLP